MLQPLFVFWLPLLALGIPLLAHTTDIGGVIGAMIVTFVTPITCLNV